MSGRGLTLGSHSRQWEREQVPSTETQYARVWNCRGNDSTFERKWHERTLYCPCHFTITSITFSASPFHLATPPQSLSRVSTSILVFHVFELTVLLIDLPLGYFFILTRVSPLLNSLFTPHRLSSGSSLLPHLFFISHCPRSILLSLVSSSFSLRFYGSSPLRCSFLCGTHTLVLFRPSSIGHHARKPIACVCQNRFRPCLYLNWNASWVIRSQVGCSKYRWYAIGHTGGLPTQRRSFCVSWLCPGCLNIKIN